MGTVLGQTRPCCPVASLVTVLRCRVDTHADESPGVPAFLAEPPSPQNSRPHRARGFQDLLTCAGVSLCDGWGASHGHRVGPALSPLVSGCPGTDRVMPPSALARRPPRGPAVGALCLSLSRPVCTTPSSVDPSRRAPQPRSGRAERVVSPAACLSLNSGWRVRSAVAVESPAGTGTLIGLCSVCMVTP